MNSRSSMLLLASRSPRVQYVRVTDAELESLEAVATHQLVALDGLVTDRTEELVADAGAADSVQQMEADGQIFNRGVDFDGDRDQTE